MLLVAAFVFSYYTVWALLTVCPAFADVIRRPFDLLSRPLLTSSLLSDHVAVPLPRLPAPRPLPITRMGRQNTRYPPGHWWSRSQWIHRECHVEGSKEEEGEGRESCLTRQGAAHDATDVRT